MYTNGIVSRWMKEPLEPGRAKSLLVALLEDGTVEYSPHARKEMAADNITEGEVMGVLRGGVVEPGEQERGSWRYRIRRSRVYVVITFRTESWTVVVTAWRNR
jgi:hypothetical protein